MLLWSFLLGRTMSQKTLFEFSYLFLILQRVFGNVMHMTELNIVQEHNLGEMGIRCASLLRNVSYLAVKLHGISGDCEGLTWQWGQNKSYMADYAYIEKTMIIQTYTPSLEGSPRTTFLLPVNVSSGGKVEISFTINDDTVDTFLINLVDTVDVKYSSNDDMVDIPVRLRFERSSEEAKIISYDGTATTQHDVISPFTILIGVPHTITIRTFANDAKVFYDGTALSRFTPKVRPGCVRLLSLQPADNISIHNVTFQVGT